MAMPRSPAATRSRAGTTINEITRYPPQHREEDGEAEGRLTWAIVSRAEAAGVAGRTPIGTKRSAHFLRSSEVDAP